MNIKRFFTLSGVFFLLTFIIVGGCNKDSNNAVNFTIDLTQAQFSVLQGDGTSVIYNNIIIARDNNGNYVAASAYCTIDNEQLTFSAASDCYLCPSGHQFNEQGVIINSPGAPPLTVYHTNLESNSILQIYS